MDLSRARLQCCGAPHVHAEIACTYVGCRGRMHHGARLAHACGPVALEEAATDVAVDCGMEKRAVLSTFREDEEMMCPDDCPCVCHECSDVCEREFHALHDHARTGAFVGAMNTEGKVYAIAMVTTESSTSQLAVLFVEDVISMMRGTKTSKMTIPFARGLSLDVDALHYFRIPPLNVEDDWMTMQISMFFVDGIPTMHALIVSNTRACIVAEEKYVFDCPAPMINNNTPPFESYRGYLAHKKLLGGHPYHYASSLQRESVSNFLQATMNTRKKMNQIMNGGQRTNEELSVIFESKTELVSNGIAWNEEFDRIDVVPRLEKALVRETLRHCLHRRDARARRVIEDKMREMTHISNLARHMKSDDVPDFVLRSIDKLRTS